MAHIRESRPGYRLEDFLVVLVRLGVDRGVVERELGFFFFCFTLVTGPRRSLGLKLSGARVYEPQIRARLGTTAHFCEVIVLKLRANKEGARTALKTFLLCSCASASITE